MKSQVLSRTTERLEELVRKRDPVKIAKEGDFVHAAVMMILKESRDELSMLFIKRPENESDPFSGHMAFPGGKMKDGDKSKLDTALRETHEEIGVDMSACGTVIGELDDVNPGNPRADNYIVTPYLSLLREEVILRPNLEEVEAAVWVPVRHLADERNAHVRHRERYGRVIEDYVYSYEKYVIWGMTGRIVRQFLSLSSYLF